MKKRIALIVLTGIYFVFTIVDYALSFGSYNDGGYKGFYFSTDALIVMLTAGILVVLAVMLLVGYIKKKNYQVQLQITCLALTGFHAFYSLFSMIKMIGSAVSNLWENEAFNLTYNDVSNYVVWFCLSAALLVYLIFSWVDTRRKK